MSYAETQKSIKRKFAQAAADATSDLVEPRRRFDRTISTPPPRRPGDWSRVVVVFSIGAARIGVI